MNFAIPLLFAVLIACAICVKNDKKKTTIENDNSDNDDGPNSVGVVPKALRVLTSILAVQSGVGLANASPQLPTKPGHSKDLKNEELSATHLLRNGPPTVQFARKYTPPAAEVGNQPLNTKTPAVQNASPSSPDRSGDFNFLNEDYAPRKHGKLHRPINNN
ncbi:hypothetical protein niasHT_015227 [Heterodera trifolii]|uniref:Uncharacterized protein n=1 Tax=Heterodera trifolii TaxID=157864 RepID=A0ABD2L2D9_9BILA